MDWPNQPRATSSSAYQGGQPSAGSIVDASYSSYTDSMAPQPIWRNAPDGGRRMSTSLEATSHNGQSQADRHLDWTGVLERFGITIFCYRNPQLTSTDITLPFTLYYPCCHPTKQSCLYGSPDPIVLLLLRMLYMRRSSRSTVVCLLMAHRGQKQGAREVFWMKRSKFQTLPALELWQPIFSIYKPCYSESLKPTILAQTI